MQRPPTRTHGEVRSFEAGRFGLFHIYFCTCEEAASYSVVQTPVAEAPEKKNQTTGKTNNLFGL